MPEPEIRDMKGVILFGVLTLIIVASSLVAYLESGHMGIEERFNNAVGIQGGVEDEEPPGELGFCIEGNPLSYVAILAALNILFLIVYFRGKSM